MIGNVRTSFVTMLDQSSWMDDASKNLAKDKVNISKYVICKTKIFILQANAIDQQIGYPDYLASDNNTKIEQDYAEVKKYLQ